MNNIDFPKTIKLDLISNNEKWSPEALPLIACQSFFNDQKVGTNINDNSKTADGYRFHDVLHLGLFAIFEWSPVLRKMMKIKTINDRERYEFEEGPRAVCADEAICLMVFNFAKNNNFNFVDLNLTDIIFSLNNIVLGLNIPNLSDSKWSKYILLTLPVMKTIIDNNGGSILANSEKETLIIL